MRTWTDFIKDSWQNLRKADRNHVELKDNLQHFSQAFKMAQTAITLSH